MKGDGDLIRSMDKVKRYGPTIILNMKVIILMGIDQGKEHSSEMESLSIKESGVGIKCTAPAPSTSLIIKCTLGISNKAQLKEVEL